MTAIEVYQRRGVWRGYDATPAEVDSVIAIYDNYDDLRGVSDAALKGPSLENALLVAIHDGYDFTQSGRKLASIRQELMIDVSLCPVCSISPPRELDHYLPKSAYLPLAIYVRNLVPFCHDCNLLKSRTEAQSPEERFIHPYFDVLPDIVFLRASVEISGDALTVEYDIDPSGLPIQMVARLSHQLLRLKLNDRYSREINSYLTSHSIALHWCFGSGGSAAVQQFLNAQAEVEANAFHKNHWRPVLLRALANHQSFCSGDFAALLPAPA